jgi:hypothetical protein
MQIYPKNTNKVTIFGRKNVSKTKKIGTKN